MNLDVVLVHGAVVTGILMVVVRPMGMEQQGLYKQQRRDGHQDQQEASAAVMQTELIHGVDG
jgi:hypothetical protein